MIRETEPLKPSTRLAQQLVAADESGLPSNAEARKPKSEQAISEASHRLLRIKERIRLVRGDLDWIVMQCLEKDRTRRYDTANGLLMDIERHLNSEPVTASPPSNLYRLGKLVRRNKLLFAASVAVLIVLLLGIGASTWQAARARRAERTARLTAESETKARQAAQSQHMKADEVVAKLALAMMSPRLDETPPRPSDTDSGIATSASTPHRAERQASLSVAIVMARREVGYWSGAMGEGLGRLFVTQLRRATNFAVAESVQLPLALPALAASKVTADDEVLRTQSREGTDYLLKTVVTRFGGGVVQIDWRIVNNLTREIRIGATGRIEGRQTETWTNYSSWRASAEDIRTEFLESPPGQALMKAISNIVEKVKTVGLTEVNARGREAPTIGVAKTESALAAPPWAPDLGRVFGERFVIELARLTNIQVLESFALDDVRAAIAPTSRGHWRGADYTFRSTVTRFGGAKSSPGQAAPSKSQSGLAGKRQIEVWIDWRIVDNATRVSAQHGTARATDEQLAEAKLDASDQQPDPYGSEDFFESALGKAAARAIEQIVERVKNLQLGPGARSINTK
jgi:curli biogenesis system outer membrane secretion channel CsgG